MKIGGEFCVHGDTIQEQPAVQPVSNLAGHLLRFRNQRSARDDAYGITKRVAELRPSPQVKCFRECPLLQIAKILNRSSGCASGGLIDMPNGAQVIRLHSFNVLPQDILGQNGKPLQLFHASEVTIIYPMITPELSVEKDVWVQPN